MSLGVYPAGEAADDDETCRGEVAAEAPRDLTPVRRARARSDDRDRGPRQQRCLGLAPQEETRRRVVDRPQERWERGIRAGEEAEAERTQPLQLRGHVESRLERSETSAPRLADEMRVARSGERRQSELVHAANSFGER